MCVLAACVRVVESLPPPPRREPLSTLFGRPAAVSSGGIILKRPGRVGQGALYGSGCFAHANAEHAVAVCTSGVGEELMKTALASECGKMMLSESCAIDAVEHAIKGLNLLLSAHCRMATALCSHHFTTWRGAHLPNLVASSWVIVACVDCAAS